MACKRSSVQSRSGPPFAEDTSNKQRISLAVKLFDMEEIREVTILERHIGFYFINLALLYKKIITDEKSEKIFYIPASDKP